MIMNCLLFKYNYPPLYLKVIFEEINEKLFILFFFAISTISYCANVYFDSPTNGAIYVLNAEGRAGVSYHIVTVNYYFVTDCYGARVQYPDGHWGAWQNGQSGGWVFTEAGTYHIQGAVHVVYDLGMGSDYYLYSNILTFYVEEPPQPLSSVYITGNYSLYPEQTGYWTANLEDGISPFTYSWEIMFVGGSEPLAASLVENGNKKQKKNDGDVIIEAAPNDEWVPVGSNSPYFQRSYNPYDLRDFYLRCTVTDNSSSTRTSPAFFVDVETQQQSIVQMDNHSTETISLNKNDNLKHSSLVATESIPSSFSLSQNYPNPFNPTTNISYTIPESGFVTLKVYDMLGREVVELVNENKPAGQNTVEFNASSLPSGTYIYKLSAGNYTQVKKMSLLK